jgi:TrmH family RNA methyltransferase
MLSQNQLKWLNALQVKKYRQKYRKFVVEGEKMVGELLAQQRIALHSIFALETWFSDFGRVLTAHPHAERHVVNDQELQKISSLSTPGRVLAVAELPEDNLPADVRSFDWCLYLDGIQDPGNLGTLLRIADWFGFPAVFCSPDCADAFSPKTVQASMGALFRVHTREIPLPDLLQVRPDWPVFGAVLGGESVFDHAFPENGLLIIGSEGRGIAPATEALLQYRIAIPRPHEGGAESLNAAVAAGILAAQVRFGKRI